jgi:hypothetical protein
VARLSVPASSVSIEKLVRMRRALLAAEERAERFQREASESFQREMSLRHTVMTQRVVYDEFMRGAPAQDERLVYPDILHTSAGPRFIAEEIERQRDRERREMDQIMAVDRPLTAHEFYRLRELQRQASRRGAYATMDRTTGLVTMHERPEPPSPALSDMREQVDETYREVMDRLSWRHMPSIITEHAQARGVAWLKSCLSPEQLADYDRTRSFVVIGGTTGHRYRICWGTSQNIIRLEELPEGRELPVERLCFGPRGVPVGDILLQQKIALEGDEEATLRIAGRTPVPDRRVANAAVWMGPDGSMHVHSNGEWT